MINENFYPTPSNVIDMMVAPFVKEFDQGNWRRTYLPFKSILEPSAGKGDIVEHLIKAYDLPKQYFSCIEIEPDLQLILQGKGYKVVDSDFLQFSDPYFYDLIIMNPPFDQGAAHLMKAWNILEKGTVICLLNAETLLNPYTKERQLLLDIINQHGDYEVVGRVFKDSERPTDVEVAIVWLNKQTERDVPFDEDGFETEAPAFSAEFKANPLASRNIIQSIVDQYNSAVRLTKDIDQLTRQRAFYVNGVMKHTSDEKSIKIPVLSEQVDALKAGFWNFIFDKTELGRRTTSNFQKRFDEFVAHTQNLAFSEANIMRVLEMFFLNQDQIIKDCIIEVFDTATKYHEKNVIHEEGWKHNKSWKIAPMIIIPYGISYDHKFPDLSPWSLGYYQRSFITDVDKALCFLAGQRLEDIHTAYRAIETRIQMLNQHKGVRHDTEFESTFFTLKIFKKGTVHLKFRDLDLLARFNQAAAEGKHWVGAGY